MKPSIQALFLDIGGVLGTNGWDRTLRAKAAEKYGLNLAEMNERHHLTFDTYEEGKITLDEYLGRVVFYEPRPFSLPEFRDFMFSESQPYQETIDWFRSIKSIFGLKVVAVSNEGRELTAHRIRKFGLLTLVDVFIASSFVHYRKPDVDFYRVALDACQVPTEKVAYIDDRSMFVEVAAHLGIQGIHHVTLQNTQAKLSDLGLSIHGPAQPSVFIQNRQSGAI